MMATNATKSESELTFTSDTSYQEQPTVDILGDRPFPLQTNITNVRENSRSRCPNIFILIHWKKWIRPLVIIIYAVVIVIVLPFCVYDLNRKDVPLHKEAWFVGGIFALLGIPISLWGILQHLVNYTQPVLQRHIVRILWMVPIYALNAWLALRFPESAIYLDVIRECYEAYVIYNFMCYLMNFLQSRHVDLALMLDNKPRVKHIIPFCCLPPWPMGQVYIDRCRHGVLQYTIIRPTMTVVAVLCQMLSVYDEGSFDPKKGWIYITVVNNISQILAMYCLIMFYRATKEELSPIQPVPKFMCVKAVVFLSFWQSVFLAILAWAGVLKAGTLKFEVKKVSAGIQDFLICIEMFLAAIAHYFSFPYSPFIDVNGGRMNWWESFKSMWDISDVSEDVADHISYVSDRVRRTMQPRSKFRNKHEKIPLLTQDNATGEYYSNPNANNSHPNKILNGNNKYTDEFPTHKEPLDTAITGLNEGFSENDLWYCSLEVSKERKHWQAKTPSLNNFLLNSNTDLIKSETTDENMLDYRNNLDVIQDENLEEVQLDNTAQKTDKSDENTMSLRNNASSFDNEIVEDSYNANQKSDEFVNCEL